jgi:hypothetical protein
MKVVKVASPVGTGTYYDIGGREGADRASLYVAYEALKIVAGARRLDMLEAEYASAEAQHAATRPEQRLCGALRIVGFHRELRQLQKLVTKLSSHSVLLSKPVQDAVAEHAAELNDLRDGKLDPAEASRVARRYLRPLGLSVREVLSYSRPLITAEEYARWFPKADRRGFTPPEFLARAVSLPRYRNPAHTHRADPDPSKAAITCVDRVDALVHAAAHLQSRVLGFLDAGAEMLGRSIRHPALICSFVRSEHEETRRTALAALVLLGSPDAISAAQDLIKDATSNDELIDAMYALLVMRELTLEMIPPRARQWTTPYLQDVLRSLVLAVRNKRWLLQDEPCDEM